jgi:hypothetical protein
MGTKSRETFFGPFIRASAERAAAARNEADRLACEAWNKRMLGYRGPAQPSPSLGDALKPDTAISKSAALVATRTRQCRWISCGDRSQRDPQLERYMRCKDCSQVRGYPFKRSHLVALRATKISASDPPSTWWPGER